MRHRTEGDDHLNPARRLINPNVIQPVLDEVATYELERNQRLTRSKPLDALQALIERHEQATDMLLANILHSNVGRKRDARYVLVPRSKAAWYSSRYLPEFFSPSIIDLLDTLSDLGWIDLHIGSADGTGLGKRTMTSIGPTERLLSETPTMTYDDFKRDEPEIIIMRKQMKHNYGSPKELMPYEETLTHIHLRNEVREINEHIASFTIEHPRDAVDTTDRQLVRIYTYGSLNSGGRLWRGFWQGLSRKWRSELLIEGEPVMEVDFRCMNWTMLYALDGTYLLSDAYDIPGLNLDRDTIKQLMNAMLFHKRRTSKWPAEMDRPGLPKIGPTVDAILLKHQPVAHRLFKGIGHQLQTLESDVMVSALKGTIQAKLPALPIHDCMVVPKSRVDDAIEIMKNAFHQHLNQWPEVDLK